MASEDGLNWHSIWPKLGGTTHHHINLAVSIE
jgi:hypothetical protein